MKIEEFEALAKKAGFDKKQMEAFKFLGYVSEDLLGTVEKYLQAKILTQPNQTPFMNPTEDVEGKINFAVTQNNLKVGINPEEPHMLIVGQTGTGKSTLLLRILTEILKLEK